MSEDKKSLEDLLKGFSERFYDAPYAARLARLAKTAKRVPEALVADLAGLIRQLDDVPLVGNEVCLQLVEVGFADLRYADATAFASVLKGRLRRYANDPDWAGWERRDVRKQVVWWCMALGGRFSRA